MGEDLTSKKCVPCEGGTPPFTLEQIQGYLLQLKNKWEVVEADPSTGLGARKIRLRFKFEDFKEAMVFVNKVADLAEEEGHHPDIYISYSKVTITLTTHAIGGLSENDFILAAKIESL